MAWTRHALCIDEGQWLHTTACRLKYTDGTTRFCCFFERGGGTGATAEDEDEDEEEEEEEAEEEADENDTNGFFPPSAAFATGNESTTSTANTSPHPPAHHFSHRPRQRFAHAERSRHGFGPRRGKRPAVEAMESGSMITLAELMGFTATSPSASSSHRSPGQPLSDHGRKQHGQPAAPPGTDPEVPRCLARHARRLTRARRRSCWFDYGHSLPSRGCSACSRVPSAVGEGLAEPA